MLECKPGAAYVRRTVGIFAAYAAVVAAVGFAFSAKLVPGPLTIPVALLPMIPAAFVPFLVLDRLRAMDELQRKIQLEAMAFALAATALLSLSYGYLQMFADLPAPNWVWVWPLLGGCQIAGIILGRWRYR